MLAGALTQLQLLREDLFKPRAVVQACQRIGLGLAAVLALQLQADQQFAVQDNVNIGVDVPGVQQHLAGFNGLDPAVFELSVYGRQFRALEQPRALENGRDMVCAEFGLWHNAGPGEDRLSTDSAPLQIPCGRIFARHR